MQNRGSVLNTGGGGAALFSHLVPRMLVAGLFSTARNWGSPFHGI